MAAPEEASGPTAPSLGYEHVYNSVWKGEKGDLTVT